MIRVGAATSGALTGAYVKGLVNGQPFGAFNVTDYGAIGDGIADDRAAIQAASTAAGVNGVLFFPPGKTYLIRAELRPPAGQTWYGYGACIKRGNEIKTTTADNIGTVSNPTVINVVDASALRVGMKVTVTTGRTDSQGCFVAHLITAITANQITVASPFTRAFPTGGTVVTNHGLIAVNSGTDRVKIYGLELDGNRLNNDTYLNWESQAAINSGSNYAVFKDLYIHDSQSDGIMFGGISTVFDSCTVLNSGGNAIHLSGATGVKVVNNFCKDATLSITGTDNNSGPAHAEGVMTFSSLIVDTTIIGNHFENGRTCIGGIGSYDNSDITIQGNTMRGATLYTIEFRSGETAAPYLQNLVMTGNRIYDSAPVTFDNNQAGGTAYESGNRNVVFSNNLLKNTRFVGTRLKHAVIEGNLFNCTGDATNTIVALYDARDVIVRGNQVIGGSYGIRQDYSTPVTGVELVGRDVLIQGNTLRNQTNIPLWFATPNGFAYRNLQVCGNSVSVETGVATVNYVAIQGGSGVAVLDNVIDQRGGARGIACGGDVVATPFGVPGTLVRGNVVRTDATKESIRIFGGSKGSIVHHNYVVQAVSNGQPADNTVEFNYTIL